MKHFTTLNCAAKYCARFFVCASVLALCIGSEAQAQPNCGDVNGDGIANISDITSGISYLFYSGLAPVNFDTADSDHGFFYTLNDVQRKFSCVFVCDIEGPCAPGPQPLLATPDSRFVFGYDDVIPSFVTRHGIRFGMGGEYTDLASALAVLDVRYGDSAIQIDSIIFESDEATFFSDIRGPGSVVIGAMNPIDASWDSNYMGKIFVTVPLFHFPGTVTLAWDTLSPAQAPPEQTGALYPLFSPNLFGGGEFLPDLAPKCCWVPGDYNSDGAFNISDVTAGLDRIFGSGPGPNAKCWDQADANSDGAFNIADVTYGIARVFGGGPAPICGTTGS